jgi:hypothetical protein
MNASPYAPTIRALYQTALVVFAVTVVIGILNGLDLVDFSRDALLTHVHAGTLGMITLSVIATAFWIFSDRGQEPVSRASTRGLAWLAGVGVPLYVVAFYSGALWARALFALPVLAAIVWFLAWLTRALRSEPMTLPRVGALAAVVALLVGGTLGTLIQVQLATGATIFGDGTDPIGGHASAMAFSYLILFGMTIADWRLRGVKDGPMPRAGLVQIGLLLVAGLLLTTGVLFNVQPLLMLNLLFELAAVAVFVWRMWPSLASIDWLAGTSQRQFGVSAVFIVVDVLLIVWLITQFIGGQGDITKVSTGLLIASDHAVFIGVMTNAILGLLMYAAERRGAVSGALAQVVFWGVNIGLVGFLVGLIGEVTILKQVFTPIMGTALLIAIVAFILALRSSEPEPMAAPA